MKRFGLGDSDHEAKLYSNGVVVNRKIEPGDKALVLRLTQRLPEGKLLKEAELATIPYDLAWLARLAALEEPLAPWPVDLLVLNEATSPVTRFEVFRRGLCLYESEPGLFGRAQDRAFFLYADSESIRRQMREVLHARPQP